MREKEGEHRLAHISITGSFSGLVGAKMVYSPLCGAVCACKDVTLQVLSMLLALLLFQCMAVLEQWCCVSGANQKNVVHFKCGGIVNQNTGCIQFL